MDPVGIVTGETYIARLISGLLLGSLEYSS